MVASKLQTERSCIGRRCGQVSLPEAHRYQGEGVLHGSGVCERAQARNLGGTAKQPFALNEGERLFFRIKRPIKENS